MVRFDKQQSEAAVKSYFANPTKANRDQAILSHKELVAWTAIQVSRTTTYFSEDELIQICMVALIEALDKFDPSRGFLFWSYAYPFVWGQMKNAIHRQHRRRMVLSDAIINHAVDYRRPEREVVDLPSWLTERQRELLIHLFWYGRTTNEAAAEMGLTVKRHSNQTVIQMLGRIVNEWRRREGLHPTHYERKQHAFVSQN